MHPRGARRRSSAATRRRRTVRLLAVTLALLLAQAAAQAAETDPNAVGKAPSVITSDTLIYDTEHGIVTATGNVEISTNQRRLLADEVRYDQKSGRVVARGNVVQIEPTGDALFGDEVEVTSDLREGFVQTVGIVLKDNSRIAATQGTRREGNIVTLDRAVYSPCPLCDDGKRRPAVADQGAARHPRRAGADGQLPRRPARAVRPSDRCTRPISATRPQA